MIFVVKFSLSLVLEVQDGLKCSLLSVNSSPYNLLMKSSIVSTLSSIKYCVIATCTTKTL